MKKCILLLIGCISITFNSCGEMMSAMSSFNESSGSVCKSYSITTYGYDKSSGKWIQDAIYNAEDGSYANEKSWVSGKQDYYLGLYKSSTYYATSPYTDVQYKFSVYCTQYQQNSSSNTIYRGVK